MRVRCKNVYECEQFSLDASAAFVSNVYVPLRAEDKVCKIKFLFFSKRDKKNATDTVGISLISYFSTCKY